MRVQRAQNGGPSAISWHTAYYSMSQFASIRSFLSRSARATGDAGPIAFVCSALLSAGTVE